MKNSECLQARKTVDDVDAYSAEQLLAAEQHIRVCRECETWRNQVNAIVATAQAVPEFDVPEALTQRILGDVQEASSGNAATVRTLVLSGVVLISAICVFSSDSIDSFDTVNGAITWLLGFLVLFGLKLLIQISEKRHGSYQKQI